MVESRSCLVAAIFASAGCVGPNPLFDGPAAGSSSRGDAGSTSAAGTDSATGNVSGNDNGNDNGSDNDNDNGNDDNDDDTGWTASGSDGTDSPASTGAESTGMLSECTLPVLIHDPFEDDDPSWGGAGAVNGGVEYVDNNVVDGSLVEADGAARVATSLAEMRAAPNVGVRTLSSFDAMAGRGVTAVAVIESADTPIWQGITLAIHSKQGFHETNGIPGLELHVFAAPATGPRSRENSVVLVAEADPEVFDYADLDYDTDTLNDGFVLSLSATPAGWSVTAEGLRSDDSTLTAQGVWDTGFEYADLLDEDSYATVSIQGQPGDPAPRNLAIASLTVFDGACEDDTIPQPP